MLTFYDPTFYNIVQIKTVSGKQIILPRSNITITQKAKHWESTALNTIHVSKHQLHEATFLCLKVWKTKSKLTKQSSQLPANVAKKIQHELFI